MAFSYRTPAEEFLASLPSEEQSKVSSHAVSSLNHQEKSSSYNYSFHLSDSQKNFCSSVGIPLSVHPFKVHPHPYCKTVENFLLFDNLVHYRSLINIYVSIKLEKVDLLYRDNNRNFCKILNRIIADRDAIRYGDCITDEKFFSESFLKLEKNKTFFFHDELHHWSLDKLFRFIGTAEPRRIFATMVLPLEVFEMDYSMNPSFYEFTVHSRTKGFTDFTFHPDGSKDSSYFQRSHSFWFKYKKIKVLGQTYTISFLRSIKAHHLILIEKGSLETNPFYISDDAECMPAKMFGISRAARSVLPIRFSVFKQELIYLLSLKKPDYHSAAAKLRQLGTDGYLPSEVIFFCTLAVELEKINGTFSRVVFSKTVFEALTRCFAERLRLCVCPSNYEQALQDLILNSKPYSVMFKRVDYPCDMPFHCFLDSGTDADLILKEFDSKMYGKGSYDSSYSLSSFDLLEPAYFGEFEMRDMRIRVQKRKQREEAFSRLNSDVFVHRGLEFQEMSYEELRFHLPRDHMKRAPGTQVLKRKSTLSYFLKLPVPLLDIIPYSTRTHKEELRRLNDDMIREVEMEDAFENVHLTTFEGSNANVTDMEISSEVDVMEEKECFDLDNLSSGDDATGTSVAFENGLPVVSEALIEELRGMLKSGFAHKHFSRTAVFVSTIPNLTYGFNNILYRNYGESCLTDVMIKLGFNSALLQAYHDGAELRPHFDDEKVYDDDEILTWNVIGSCVMELHKKSGLEVIPLTTGNFVTFESGSQRGPNKYKHGVKACKGNRISITFRHQKRFMNGEPIESTNVSSGMREIPENIGELMNKMQNTCFLDALAEFLKMDRVSVVALLFSFDVAVLDKVLSDSGFETSEIISYLIALGIPGSINDNGSHIQYLKEGSYSPIFLSIRERHVTLENVASVSGTKTDLERAIISAGAKPIEVDVDMDDARKLIKSMQEGAVGVLLSKFKFAFNSIDYKPGVKHFSVAGFAGSGKSRGIQAICSGVLNLKETIIISPRRNLIEDWKEKIDRMLNGRVCRCKRVTYEDGIKKIINMSKKNQTPMNIILDEVSLLPGGYIDLVSLVCNPFSRIVLIFDPLQASFFDRRSVSFSLPDIFKPLYNSAFEYMAFTHRLPKILNFEGIEFLGKSEISEHHMRFFAQPEAAKHILKKVTFLCPSEDKREELKRYGDAYTFGTSQGLTFDFVVISLDMDGPVTSDTNWMVALTRARKGFAFLTCASISLNDFKKRCSSKLIGKVLGNSNVSNDFLRALGGRVMDNVTMRGKEGNGRNRDEFEEALEGDPWLKAQLLFLERPELLEPDIEEVVRKDSPPRTHLEIASEKLAFVEGPSTCKAREFREFRGSNMWSCQFDDYKKNRVVKENRVETFETIYPYHSNSDTLTFWAAVRKRLVFSDSFTQRRKLERLHETGRNLFEIFAKEYNLKRGVRVDEDEINYEFIEKRLSKSRNLISMHSERSDPDWLVNNFFLFMKTQLCTKYEKRFADAKAGQTLACFSHSVLARFGVPIRIAEAKLRACLPESIYIHSGKKLEELNEWSIKYCTDFGTDSDYEAFDRSQDALILAFEIHLLKFLGWDNSLISDYTNLKINLGCRLGNLAIMRFTGEFGTFFLNTCCNMLFTCLRYMIDSKTPIAFAGDDMFSPRRLKIRRDREFLLNRFSLKAKVNFSAEPMFCGWRMSKFGIVKEPKLVLERFHIAKEKGCFKECLINYCLEVSFAYRLGERLRDVIRNIEDQQALVRIVVLNKHLLPEKVRKEFESYDHEFGGCESVPEEGRCNRVHSFGCGLECNL